MQKVTAQAVQSMIQKALYVQYDMLSQIEHNMFRGNQVSSHFFA